MQWFDKENGQLRLDEEVVKRPSFQAIMADGLVSDEELSQQTQRVIALLRELEKSLPENLRKLAGDCLVELSVLHAIYHYYELQNMTRKV